MIYLWAGAHVTLDGDGAAEPVNVAKFLDDLWVGVIGLSNLVIAGSPRNVSKYGLVSFIGVAEAH